MSGVDDDASEAPGADPDDETLAGNDSVGDDETLAGNDSVGDDETLAGNDSVGDNETLAGNDSVGDDETLAGNDSVGDDEALAGNDSVGDDEAVGDVVEGGVADKPDPVLEVEDVTKRFGGLVANDAVTMAVERGSITGLIGPNGAGKSTLFNCITGFHDPDEGSVWVDGEEVTGRDPHEVAQAGLIRSFQTPRKPEGMTVREALLAGPQGQTGESIVPLFTRPESVREEEAASLARAEELLAQFEIDHLATALATDLSGGQMKLVELARAMMADPDVLLLDEPVAGINPTLAEKLKGFLQELNEEGVTFLVIEHDMSFIMDVADTIVVLNQGEVLVEGPPEAVRTDERVVDAYLGGPRT